MPTKTLTGESTFSVPANATGVSATVGGAGATLSLISPGLYSITAPAVTPSSVVVVTYTDTVVGRRSAIISAPVSRSADVGAVETIVHQVRILAGTLRVGDRIRVYLTLTKNGAVDTGTLTFRMGTAGTTADTNILSTTPLAAANRAGGLIFEFKITSLTQSQRMGNHTAAVGAYSVVGNTAFVAPITIPDVSANNLWFSISLNSSGATNTVALEDCTIHHIPTP